MDQESVVLEVDPRSVHAAIVQANKDVESWEKGMVGAGDRMQKSLERMADMLIKMNDRSRSSMERLTQSIEKQAAAYGKTGVDRLISERDRLIKKLGDEEGMINRVRAAYDKMIAVERASENGGGGMGGSGFNARYAFFGIKDVLEGRTRFAIAEAANEIMRLRGAALLIGGSVAGVAALGYAAYEVAKGLREIEEEPEKIRRAFGGLGETLHAQEDQLRATNSRMEDTIAKLQGRPTNGLQTALYDARVEADRLAESLTADLDKLTKLMEKQEVSRWHQVLGDAGTSDVTAMVGRLSNAQGLLLEEFDRRMRHTKTADDVKSLQTEFGRRLQNLYGAAQGDIKQWQQMPAGAAGLQTLLLRAGSILAPTLPGLLSEHGVQVSTVPNATAWQRMWHNDVYIARNDASRQETLQQTSAKLQDLLDIAMQRIKGAGLKSTEDALKGSGTEGLTSALAYARRELASVRDTDPFAVLARERDTAIAEATEKYKAAAGPLIDIIKQTYDAKWVKEFNTEVEKNNNELESQATRWNRLAVEAGKAHDALYKDEIERGLARFDKQTIEDFKQRVQEAREWARFYDEERFGRMGAAGSFAERAIALTSTGGEVQTLAQQIQVREAIRAEELKIKEAHDDIYDVDRERWNAELANLQDRYQYEEKILEVQRKEREEIQNTAAGLFHTLLTKPGQFPKQFESTIHEAVIRPVAQGLGGIAAGALQPLIFGTNGEGGVASIFKGAFGGGAKDPVKVTVDNTTATVENSGRLAALTAVVSAMAGIQAPTLSLPSVPGMGGVSIPSVSMPVRPGAGSGTASGAGWGGGPAGWFGGGFAGLVNSFGFGIHAPTVAASVPLFLPAAGGSATGWGGGGPSVAAGGGDYTPIGGFSPIGISTHDLANLPMSHGPVNPAALLNLTGGKGSGLSLSNLKGSLGNLQNAVINPDIWNATGTSFGAYAGSVLTSPAATTAGFMLGTAGLLGSHRGTWGGIGMGTVGGALTGAGIGAQFGGPEGALIGAGIGAAAGFGIGVSEKLLGIESPEEKAKKYVKQIYGINIEPSMAKQIAGIAQQKYAGDVAVAVRDPQVRQMLQVYAEGTGQRFPLSASTPVSGSLAEQGGKLYQQASYVNGVPYTFQSSLPVLGGFTTGTYPGAATPAGMSSGGGVNLALNINGQAITPEFVADQSMAAQGASYGRTQQAANMQVPGLMVA